MNGRIVGAAKRIDASCEAVFALLCDPNEHAVLDGSGMIRGTHGGATRLGPGSVFEMRMQLAGGRYRIENRVVEFEEPRLIAWEVHPAGAMKALRERLVGGHRWRYRLTEADGATLVEEEFDYSNSPAPWLIELLGFPKRNARAIEQTLDRLADRFSTQR